MFATSYPNQKVVVIDKEEVQNAHESGRPYIIAYADNMFLAMQNLKPNTFKAFIYLCSNTAHYKFALSTKDLAEECGISISTAQAAVKELIATGYLIHEGGNVYHFTDHPKELDEFEIEDEVRWLKSKTTGEWRPFTYDELATMYPTKVSYFWSKGAENKPEGE